MEMYSTQVKGKIAEIVNRVTKAGKPYKIVQVLQRGLGGLALVDVVDWENGEYKSGAEFSQIVNISANRNQLNFNLSRVQS